jgi:hypothetical protein
MKEFNPLEKPSQKDIKKSVNQKILKNIFGSDDLGASLIDLNEKASHYIKAQEIELEALSNSKNENHSHIIRKVKGKIRELDLRKKAFRSKAFENEVDSKKKI